MTDEKVTEIIERLARIEEKVNSVKAASEKTTETVTRHETDIQRAKGVIFFLGVITSVISIKNLLMK